MLYILNLYSAVCQLYLNKTGRKQQTNQNNTNVGEVLGNRSRQIAWCTFW